MHLKNILLIVLSPFFIEGLDINLKFCEFQCSDTCSAPVDTLNPIGEAKPPKDYYWRDFYGVVPIDAYPLGPITQFPQTYIGLVYDPSKNGTFVTTIYEGLDYVYTVLHKEVTKIDKHIQILCTEHPDQLYWFKLTEENLKAITATFVPVRGSYHMENTNKTVKFRNHFIVKTKKCGFPYVGVLSKLNEELEYAKIDGSSDTTDQYLWLTYEKSDDENSGGFAGSAPPMNANIQASGNIDINNLQASTKITIGSCTATCSTEAMGTAGGLEIGNVKDLVKLTAASMAYYWKPKPVIAKDEAFEAGNDFTGKQYVGQAYSSVNIWDVGPSDLEDALLRYEPANLDETTYYHVLSTNFPETLKWVNTTAQDFVNQDRDKMIPGGAFFNGTDTFVCRELYSTNAVPGSARVEKDATYCYSKYGPVPEYQVLLFEPNISIDPQTIINPASSIIESTVVKNLPTKGSEKFKL